MRSSCAPQHLRNRKRTKATEDGDQWALLVLLGSGWSPCRTLSLLSPRGRWRWICFLTPRTVRWLCFSRGEGIVCLCKASYLKFLLVILTIVCQRTIYQFSSVWSSCCNMLEKPWHCLIFCIILIGWTTSALISITFPVKWTPHDRSTKCTCSSFYMDVPTWSGILVRENRT